MEWPNDCSVGIPVLDEQHYHVRERFECVKETMARGEGWNDLHLALTTLIERFELCVAVEEALMRIHGYPESERHRKEHADLLLCLRRLEKANLSNGLTGKMIGVAFASMMGHHLTEDRRHARHLMRLRGETPVACP